MMHPVDDDAVRLILEDTPQMFYYTDYDPENPDEIPRGFLSAPDAHSRPREILRYIETQAYHIPRKDAPGWGLWSLTNWNRVS